MSGKPRFRNTNSDVATEIRIATARISSRIFLAVYSTRGGEVFNKAKLRAELKKMREENEQDCSLRHPIGNLRREVEELKGDFQRNQTVGIPRIEPEMKFNDHCELYNKNTEEVPIKVAIQMIIDHLGLAYVDGLEKVDITPATLVIKRGDKNERKSL